MTDSWRALADAEVLAHWPKTTHLMFNGGPKDGETMPCTNPLSTMRFPYMPRSRFPLAENDPSTLPSFKTYEYRPVMEVSFGDTTPTPRYVWSGQNKAYGVDDEEAVIQLYEFVPPHDSTYPGGHYAPIGARLCESSHNDYWVRLDRERHKPPYGVYELCFCLVCRVRRERV